MSEKDDLDRLLDSALSTYADPGDSGFEDRLLLALASARVGHTAVVRRHRRWPAWVVAIPVAACLLVLLLTERNAHPPSTHPQMALHSNPEVGAPERPKLMERPPGGKVRPKAGGESARLKSCPVTKPQDPLAPSGNACPSPKQTASSETLNTQAALPKLDVFPTPQPLTVQERGLALLSAHTKPPLRKAIVEAQNEDTPVHIAAIHIPPIAPPSQTQP